MNSLGGIAARRESDNADGWVLPATSSRLQRAVMRFLLPS